MDPKTELLDIKIKRHGTTGPSAPISTGLTEAEKYKGRLTCIDSDGGVPTSSAIDCSGYGRAHERAEGDYGEVHARTTADICRVTKCDHRRTDECRKRADRCAIEQGKCYERACPVNMRPDEGQYARDKYRRCHYVQRACP